MALHKLQEQSHKAVIIVLLHMESAVNPPLSLSRLFGLSQLQLIHLNYFYRLPIGAFSNIATISAVFCRRQRQGR